MQNVLPRHGLYAVTDTVNLSPEDMLDRTRLLLDAGVSLIQYRNKVMGSKGCMALGEKLSALCRRYQVPLIVNDDPQLACKLDAAGVHLGKEDADISEVRQQYPALLLGVSCYNDLNRARNAVIQGADYVAFGAFFKSPNKPDAVCASIELLEQANTCIEVPIVAIGGITPENGPRLVSAGAHLLAVISGLYGHPDPYHQARKFLQLFKS